MFCKDCGAKINNGVAFCTNCGSRAVNSAMVQEQKGVRAVYRSLALSPLFIIAISFFSVASILNIMLSISSYEEIFLILDFGVLIDAGIDLVKFMVVLLLIVPSILLSLMTVYGMWDIFASVIRKSKEIKTPGFAFIQFSLSAQWVFGVIGYTLIVLAIAASLMVITGGNEREKVILITVMIFIISFVWICVYYITAINAVSNIKAAVNKNIVCKRIPTFLAVMGFLSAIITLTVGIYAQLNNSDLLTFTFSLFSSVASFAFGMFILKFNSEMSLARKQDNIQQPQSESFYI